MKLISLPRTLFKRQLTTRDNVQLHAFTDASLIWMSAVVYVRVEYQPEKQLATQYVIDKSKVAPIKQLSIPKLELEAAIIGFWLCNIRLLQSHMRLKKNRPYNHWLKGQGHYLLCFPTSRTVGASSVRLWHETTTRYSLKATTKISPHSRIRNVPILRSLDTQNTWTPLKTGLEQSVRLLFIRQCDFDPFQMDQPKTRLTST